MALAAAVFVAPCSAQEQPAEGGRQSNGVFRAPTAARHDLLRLTSSLYGAHDDELPGGDGSSASNSAAGGGPFSGLDTDIRYVPVQRRQHVGFTLQGSSSLRYYVQQARFVTAGQSLDLGTSTRLSRSLSLQGRGGASYLPYFDFSTVDATAADAMIPEGAVRIRDNTLATRRALTFDGGVDLTHSRNERTSLSVRSGVRRTRLLDENQTSLDLTTSAGIAHRTGRRVGVRAAYIHRQSDNQQGVGSRTTQVDDVEFGLDRSWARSPTRRTDLSLTLGPSAIQQRGERAYRLFGGAALTHPFGRSWNLRSSYRRGVTFLERRSEAFLSDSLTVGLSGLLSPRLETSLSTGMVLGDLGLDAGAGGTTPVDTYTGSGRMRLALGRGLALYGEYVYNFSKYSGGAPADSINRSGIRIGISAYVPLLQQAAAGAR